MSKATATITRFYTAFANLDGAAMASCYAANAKFQDPVFDLSGAEEIGSMWKMLCANTSGNPKSAAAWKLEFRDVTDASAHWEAHYIFSTGRSVHNIIEAKIEVDTEGLIVNHCDTFPFWAWSRQALGASGLLLGWTPLLRSKVKRTAASSLKKYREKQDRTKV